jgi:DNA modification methylase
MISSEGELRSGRMKQKYGASGGIMDTIGLYTAGMLELYRVLRSGGILVVKCQDTIWGRRNYWLHANVLLEAEKIGFRAEDLFIKLNKSAMMPWNMQRQNHARKMHSYFWVFKKRRNSV